MTEAEWHTCTDPLPMLRFLRGQVSDRKLRLFAVACSRRIEKLLVDEQSRRAVEVAERFADGRASEDERHQVAAEASRARNRDWYNAALAVPYYTVALDSPANHPDAEWNMAVQVIEHVDLAIMQRSSSDRAEKAERQHQSQLLREIFGPLLFRPVKLGPAEPTSTAVQLAEAIYEERAYDRLPILADALEDAGCTDAAILNHCRQPGEHVRGCWVLDLALGRR